MSDSWQPYELQPVRLLCPWDSPGQNTGVGCPPPGHLPGPGIESKSLMSPALAGEFFNTSTTWEAPYIVCVALCLVASVVSNSWQPCGLQPARLLYPWGFSRQEYWGGLPCPPPGDLPNPGFEPRSPTLQADSLLTEPPGKPMHGL